MTRIRRGLKKGTDCLFPVDMIFIFFSLQGLNTINIEYTKFQSFVRYICSVNVATLSEISGSTTDTSTSSSYFRLLT